MISDPGRGSLMSDINVTPFVDVMLVLLIIFMVTAPMMVQGVDVALPETGNAASLQAEEDPLVVSVDRTGGVHINDVTVDVASLGDKLKKVFESRASREVFLKADKAVAYGRVVEVMTQIKAAGVEHLGVVTEPVESGKPI